jgi:hypothetical protein
MFDSAQLRQNEGPVTWAEPGGSTPLSEQIPKIIGGVARSTPIGAATMAEVDILRNPKPYTDIFTAAERQTRLVDNFFAEDRAKEEAYDRQIAAVKEATGVELQNPLRGGYAQEARHRIRDEVRAGGMTPIDSKGGIPEYQRRMYDENLAAVREKHPDLPEADLAVSTIARSVAAEAESVKPPTAGLDPVGAFGASMAGGLWAGRRDPLFVGSLFAGPTSAVGATTTARIASAGLFQGLFNAGLSALEQPSVQAWRADIGAKSGTLPALENVGLAFVFGLIPGAIFRGAHEATAARGAIDRVMGGKAEPADMEPLRKVLAALGDDEAATPARAMRMGEEMGEADKALIPPAGRDVAPELHDDMMAAALKRADDPEAPAPEAIAALRQPDQELAARVEEARPQNIQEAQVAATEVLEQRGTKATATRLSEELDAFHGTPHAFEDFDAAKAPFYFTPHPDVASGYAFQANIARPDATPNVRPVSLSMKRPYEVDRRNDPGSVGNARNPEWLREHGYDSAVLKDPLDPKATEYLVLDKSQITPKFIAPKFAAKDPLGKIPYVRDDGTPTTISAAQAAKIGQREGELGMLVRSCK